MRFVLGGLGVLILATALIAGYGIEPAVAAHKPGHKNEGPRGEGHGPTTTLPATTTTLAPTTTAPAPAPTTTRPAASKAPTKKNTTTTTSTSTTTTTLAEQDEVVAFLPTPSGSPPNTTPEAVPIIEEEPVVGLNVSLGSTFVGLTVEAMAFPLLAFVVPAAVAIWLSFKERRREPEVVEG